MRTLAGPTVSVCGSTAVAAAVSAALSAVGSRRRHRRAGRGGERLGHVAHAPGAERHEQLAGHIGAQRLGDLVDVPRRTWWLIRAGATTFGALRFAWSVVRSV